MSNPNAVAFSIGIVPWQQARTWMPTARFLDDGCGYDGSWCGRQRKHLENVRSVRRVNARFLMSGDANGAKDVNLSVNGKARNSSDEYTQQAVGNGSSFSVGDTKERSSGILDHESSNKSDDNGRSWQESVDDLKKEYKAAKADYKDAKEAYEKGDTRSMNGMGWVADVCVSAERVRILEREYRDKKAVYKRAKETRKAMEKGSTTKKAITTMTTKTTKTTAMKTNEVIGDAAVRDAGATHTLTPTTARSAAVVTVCGSKTCARLGAQAVANVLGPAASLVPKCMSRCGGVGPSVRLGDGRVVKVDLKAAVRNAINQNTSVSTRTVTTLSDGTSD